MSSFGKRKKDNQTYPKFAKKKTTMSKIGSIKSAGKKILPTFASVTRNPPSSVTWEKAFDKYEGFKEKTKLPAFSFDAEDGKGYNFGEKGETIQFYNEFNFPPYGDSPIYLVSMTNQVGEQLTRELHSNFLQAQNSGYRPLIGYWRNDKGIEYTDITLPMSNTSASVAKNYAKSRQQEGIVAIYKNGNFEYIPVE